MRKFTDKLDVEKNLSVDEKIEKFLSDMSYTIEDEKAVMFESKITVDYDKNELDALYATKYKNEMLGMLENVKYAVYKKDISIVDSMIAQIKAIDE